MKPAILICLALVALALPVDAGWFSRRTPTPTPTPLRKAQPPPTPTPVPTPRPPPRELVALPVYDEETSVRLQIFLDNHEFGPGKIDGKMGEFFGKALVAYKKANGLPPTGAVDGQLLAQVPQPLHDLHHSPGGRAVRRGDGLEAIGAGEIEGDEVRVAARVRRGTLSRGGGFSCAKSTQEWILRS